MLAVLPAAMIVAVFLLPALLLGAVYLIGHLLFDRNPDA